MKNAERVWEKTFQKLSKITDFWKDSSTIALGLNVPGPLGGHWILDILYQSNGMAIEVPEKNLLPLTKEFNEIKHDKAYSTNSRAARYLQSVVEQPLSDKIADRYQDAQRHLANWDLSTDLDNRGAALGTCIIGG